MSMLVTFRRSFWVVFYYVTSVMQRHNISAIKFEVRGGIKVYYDPAIEYSLAVNYLGTYCNIICSYPFFLLSLFYLLQRNSTI